MRYVTWTREDADGNEITTQFPAKWEICDRCDGHGSVDHPAFSNGITSSEWAEWDDDDREHYLQGRYDVDCPNCENGKVLVIDLDRIPDGSDLAKELEDYHNYQDEMAEYDRIREAERRFGA